MGQGSTPSNAFRVLVVVVVVVVVVEAAAAAVVVVKKVVVVVVSAAYFLNVCAPEENGVEHGAVAQKQHLPGLG
jgi:hypothetical protein